MRYIGIDPGLDGVFAEYDAKSNSVTPYEIPTVRRELNGKERREVSAAAFADDLRDLIAWGELASGPIRDEGTHALTFAVEKVGPMPKQGVSSVWSFGRTVGMIEGVLGALDAPIVYVTPQVWQRALKVPKGKDGSRIRATELWPAQADLFRRVKDHNRSDACLIAYWNFLYHQRGK